MKKIEILSKKNPNFIGCWNMENKKLCENIIKFFENNPKLQYQGETASGQEISRKKTTDITISPKDLSNPEYKVFQDYFEELQKCFLDYREQWPFL